jgi:hypothetical protein
VLSASSVEGLRAIASYPPGTRLPLAYRTSRVEMFILAGAMDLFNPRTHERMHLEAGSFFVAAAGVPYTLNVPMGCSPNVAAEGDEQDATGAAPSSNIACMTRVLLICKDQHPVLVPVSSSDADVE